MRISVPVAVLLASAPVASFACSCMGTQSIGSAMESADAVVMGRVLPSEATSGDSFAPAKFEVLKTLKGDARGDIYVSTQSLCYQSFNAEDFKQGEIFVLPLTAASPAPAGGPPPAFDAAWQLPGCSHNALLHKDGYLYTNELTADGGRVLDRYLSLPIFDFLFSMGAVNLPVTFSYLGIIGGIALAFALLRNWRLRRLALAGTAV
jgi:hypothetical protein